MITLAIETSCDETAAAVVKDGRKILSSAVASQAQEHAQYGGVVPEIASRRHTENIVQITELALKEAGLSLPDIDAVAVTAAPGLIGALLVGVNFAKGLSAAASKPLIPVHHIRGHVAALYPAFPALSPPFLALVASGGHTYILNVTDYTAYHVMGRTLDDAVGEAFDKAARRMGFPYPGGALLDKQAQAAQKTQSREIAGTLTDKDELIRQNIKSAHLKYPLPKPKTENPLDFSFSGLKTAVVNLLHNAEQRSEPVDIGYLCLSFQQTVSDILAQKTVNAATSIGAKTVVLAGGAAANSAVRGALSRKCAENGMAFYVPPVKLCGDNAAMIGAQAYYEYLAGHVAGLELDARATMPVTEEF
jgi:N6-L-threonylcarbamoyladenine synthase